MDSQFRQDLTAVSDIVRSFASEGYSFHRWAVRWERRKRTNFRLRGGSRRLYSRRLDADIAAMFQRVFTHMPEYSSISIEWTPARKFDLRVTDEKYFGRARGDSLAHAIETADKQIMRQNAIDPAIKALKDCRRCKGTTKTRKSLDNGLTALRVAAMVLRECNVDPAVLAPLDKLDSVIAALYPDTGWSAGGSLSG